MAKVCVAPSAQQSTSYTLIMDPLTGTFSLVSISGTLATPRKLGEQQWKAMRLVDVQTGDMGAPLSEHLDVWCQNMPQDHLPIRPATDGLGVDQLQRKVVAAVATVAPDWTHCARALRKRVLAVT